MIMRYVRDHPMRVAICVLGVLFFLWLLVQFGIFGTPTELRRE